MPDSKANADVLNPNTVKNNAIFFKILLLNYGTYILKQNIFHFSDIVRIINLFKINI